MSGRLDYYRQILQQRMSEPDVSFQEVEKTASAGVSPLALESDESLVEKLASALEGVADLISPERRAASVVAKLAGHSGPLATSATAGAGHQNYNMGAGRNQPKSHGLKRTDNSPSPTGLEDDSKDKARLQGQTQKQMAAKLAARQAILDKLASAGELSTSAAGEGPKASGSDASLVGSNERAMSFTPRDAKKTVKQELAALFNEPALSAATDPVLVNNFDNAGRAGTKIAHVLSLLGVEKTAGPGWDKAVAAVSGYGRRLANKPNMRDAAASVMAAGGKTGKDVGDKFWKGAVSQTRKRTAYAAGGAAAVGAAGYGAKKVFGKKESE